MRYVAVLEHRLRPGAETTYLDAVRAASAAIGTAEGRGNLAVAFADGDPLHALWWATWSSKEARVEALQRVPADVRGALFDAVEQNAGPARWYRCLWWAERMPTRPEHAVALRFRLLPEHVEEILAWQQVVGAEGLREDRDLVFLCLCRAEDDPAAAMVLMLRRTPGRSENLAAFLERHPPPHPLLGMERFTGRIDLRWDPADPAPAQGAPTR